MTPKAKIMGKTWRRILLLILIVASLFLTFYSMPGIFSIASFSGAIIISLLSFLPLFRKKIRERPPISLFVLIIIIPFILGAIVLIEGLISWRNFLQVFVAWSLTITFWFNFMMIPLAIYHTRLEEKRRKERFIYPPISIIIPAYNEEKVIASTLEAVLEADYPAPKEVIVVDDGSTDRTYSIAKSFEFRGVKVFHKPNGGKFSAINFGTLFSKNPIIVTIDADTIIGRDSLKEIVKPFKDPSVAGVAGNVLVLNKVNTLTKCQALEYILSINIMRRAMDLFGTVPVVPGVIGAFRREIIQSMGGYDPDTLTEDFDVTVKSLKAGKIVQASSNAIAFTEAPQTLKDLYRQRIRWYRGNVQTVLKHRDIFSTKRYGILRTLAYPYVLMNLFIIPFLTFPVWAAAFLTILDGYWQEITLIFILFVALQALHSTLAIDLSGEEDISLVAYSPLMVVGYKHIIDFLVMKAAVEVVLGRKGKWTRSRRYGAVQRVRKVKARV